MRCSAGFQTCCVADFQIGRASKMRGVRRFRNLRYGRLGRLRYQIGSPIMRTSGCETPSKTAPFGPHVRIITMSA